MFKMVQPLVLGMNKKSSSIHSVTLIGGESHKVAIQLVGGGGGILKIVLIKGYVLSPHRYPTIESPAPMCVLLVNRFRRVLKFIYSTKTMR